MQIFYTTLFNVEGQPYNCREFHVKKTPIEGETFTYKGQSFEISLVRNQVMFIKQEEESVDG